MNPTDPALILDGPVAKAIDDRLRCGSLPDLEELKARFPEVADLLDRFVPEQVVNSRAIQRALRAELLRLLREILAAVERDEPLDAASLRSRFPFMTERIRETTIPELLGAIAHALWMPRNIREG
jgi:hypothetical protein